MASKTSTSCNFLNILGFTYALCTQLYGIHIHGLKMIVFLTSWCGIIQCYTFIYLMTSGKSQQAKKLLITSWSLGWTVTLFFWVYVYPLTESQKLPPVLLYISSHGGINLIMTIRFLLSDLRIEINDFKWPCIVVIVYFFGMIMPFKFFGFTVYPLFMEKLFPTILIIVCALTCLWLCFYIGLLFKSKSVNKIREE